MNEAPMMQQDEAIHATTAPNSSLMLHIDRSVGRQFMLILWASCAISAFALAALLFTRDELRTVKAKYEVLQYDHQSLKAQLVAKGVYEATEH